MKKVLFVVLLSVILLIFAGCSNFSDQNTQKSNSIQTTNKEESSASSSSEHDEENKHNVEETPDDPSPDNGSVNVGVQEDKENLSQYSSKQIEYARIWLQLGPNQEIEELNVRYIPAGSPINPDDETSADYPEDVIQLAGSRLIDGSVTYSGNGDGTINLYNVPLRWDGSYPAGVDFYTDIIDNTKLVYVDTGDDEKIIKLIKLLKEHS